MPERNALQHPETEAGIATAEGGFVVLDGPDGVAVTMTADAAAQTGNNLISAAEQAARQAQQGIDRD